MNLAIPNSAGVQDLKVGYVFKPPSNLNAGVPPKLRPSALASSEKVSSPECAQEIRHDASSENVINKNNEQVHIAWFQVENSPEEKHDQLASDNNTHF